MKYIILILTIILITHLATAQTLITVKQDGTGDFTIIQEAVDAAVDGDTVLVWPGTYYENIYYNGKNITLGSLTLTTGDLSFISQTIIDGSQSGSCLAIENSGTSSTICGFTLRNGSGRDYGDFSGGGMFIIYSNIRIINCVLRDNKVTGSGGGIWSHESNVFLSGATIKNNHAYNHGGGISFGNGSIKFDTLNLCSIYLNYAAIGTDIFKGIGDSTLHVMVDTFTVLSPDYYYLFSYFGGNPPNDITWEINAGKIQAVNQDLYVSPDGDNQNSGLSPASPLKDIWFAMLKMASDSLQPDTIHLAPGEYKMSTGEKYPLSLKKYVSIKGTSRDSCILDAEDDIFHLNGIFFSMNYQISNITLQHGNGYKFNIMGYSAIQLRFNYNSLLTNILIRENNSRLSAIDILNSNNISFINVEIIDNIGGTGLRTGHGGGVNGNVNPDTVQLRNCWFNNNLPDYSIPPEEGGFGGGMSVIGDGVYQDLLTTELYNCLFTKNHSRQHPYGGMSQISMSVSRNANAYVINCTFGNNSSDNLLGGNIAVTSGSNLYIYNSILYNNDPAEIYMYTDEDTCNLNIYNSLVQGGEEGIRLYTSGNTVYYDPTNIDTNPLWDTACMYPYSLSAGSPCIDAGTLNLPPGIELPETDLVGNPRVYNGYVDMGAYEFGPWVQVPVYELPEPEPLLKAWPNPFRFETNISYISPEKGHTSINIYSMEGKLIKTLMDVSGLPGSGSMKWDGKDQYGQPLKAGTYIICLNINGKEMDMLKVIKH